MASYGGIHQPTMNFKTDALKPAENIETPRLSINDCSWASKLTKKRGQLSALSIFLTIQYSIAQVNFIAGS